MASPREELAARLRAMFADELDEQLRTLNDDLLALEQRPEDAERLRSVFRVAHTLKGAARAAGVRQIEEACHAIESQLSGARDGARPLSPPQLALMFSAADALAEAAARLRAGEEVTGGALAQLIVRLKSVGGRSSAGARSPVPDAPVLARQAAAVPAEPAAAAPPQPEVAETLPPGDSTVAPGEAGGEAGSTRTRRDGDAPVTAPAHVAPTDQLRIAATQLDTIVAAASELLGLTGTLDDRPIEVSAIADEITAWRAEWRRGATSQRAALERAGSTPAQLASFDAVGARLDRLMRGSARLARGIGDDARAVGATSARLADGVRRLRTRPFGDIAESLPRALRDVAVSVGKEARLALGGQEIEADRAVLDALREPLLHLVRNAVDHGLEATAARVALGKPAAGTITVRATLRGDQLVVTVADDGAGLDLAGIRGRLRRQQRSVPSDPQELARTLFEGGFSTRENATAISGRGVGLDIVRTAVERLGGTADVTWTAGQGTTFTLEVPLSVATLHAILVLVNGHRFALPTAFVERLVRVAAADVRRVDGRTVLPMGDGAPMPLVSLARLLGPPLAERRVEGALPVVVLAGGGRRLGVVVDELVEERELIVRPIEHADAATAQRFTGAAILEGNSVGLVVNAGALLAAAARSAGGVSAMPSLDLGNAAAAPRTARILVADDSITTRTLEESTLSAAGYDVVTAVDGADAWRVVSAGGIDLLVSDVEMPQMDGFALCTRIRASRDHATLPVILVTSLDQPEHRARGLEAGANAYITKSSFDQDALLATVRQLLGQPR